MCNARNSALIKAGEHGREEWTYINHTLEETMPAMESVYTIRKEEVCGHKKKPSAH
jgi:hypothetical protein